MFKKSPYSTLRYAVLTNEQTGIHTDTQTHTYTQIYMYTHTDTHVHRHTGTQRHIHRHTHSRIHTDTHRGAYTHTGACTQTRTNTHRHRHTHWSNLLDESFDKFWSKKLQLVARTILFHSLSVHINYGPLVTVIVIFSCSAYASCLFVCNILPCVCSFVT